MKDSALDRLQQILGSVKPRTKEQLRTVLDQVELVVREEMSQTIETRALELGRNHRVGDFLILASDDGQNLRVQTHTNRGAIQIKPETGNSIIVVNTRSSAGPRV